MNKPVEPKEPLDIQAILRMGASPVPSWMQRRELKWAIGVVTGLLLILTAWWWLGGGATTVRYATEPATRGNLVVIVTATGSVQPTKKVDISSELSGTVRKVLVDYNSPVVAGQPLAELDTDKLKATVDSSRAKLAAAQAKVAEAEATVTEKQRDLDRRRRLVATQAVSVEEADQAQAAYDRAVASGASARADVDVAKAQLHIDETNLSKACICSPIDGIVLKRDVDPGQIVAATLQAPVLFSIAEDLKQMELQVDVDEADVGKVKVGQIATFSVDAFPDRRFPATIRDIRFASETIQGVVTYKAVLNVDNSDLSLRPGMTATADITVAEINDALLIPNAALRYAPTTASAPSRSFLRRLLPGPPPRRPASAPEQTGRKRTVWVLRDGEPAEVKIEVGLSDGKRTEVQSGELRVDEELVVDQATSK